MQFVWYIECHSNHKRTSLFAAEQPYLRVFSILLKMHGSTNFWNHHSTRYLALFAPCQKLDDCVGNESLETLYWLKWGFVIMITGYVYSQKCKKNAKLNWVITFWILVAVVQKINKKNTSRGQNILTFSFWHFHYTFDYKYSQWS